LPEKLCRDGIRTQAVSSHSEHKYKLAK